METSLALLQYLQSQYLMVLASCGEEISAANLYFLSDDELNIYFMSNKSTQHCLDIAINPQVAVAISDTSRTPDMPKIGAQLKGTAEMMTDTEEIARIITLWNEKFVALGGKAADADHFGADSDTRLYVIKPDTIKFYNTELFADTQEISPTN